MLPGQAIVIPPLQTIQMQMATICQSWEIPYLNISDITNPAEIAAKLEETDPKIILCSIEDISDPRIQSQLQSLNVSYVALDECQVHLPSLSYYSHLTKIISENKPLIMLLQVADPEGGWCEIRPYSPQTWKFLRASYKCPFMLLSATMEEDSLDRILGMYKVSQKCPLFNNHRIFIQKVLGDKNFTASGKISSHENLIN